MKTRKLSIRLKLLICISLVSVACCLTLGFFTYLKAKEIIESICGQYDISMININPDLKQLKVELVLIVIIACLICVTISIFFIETITKNLKIFYEKVNEINSGDGDLNQKLDIKSGDELEEIAGEFNKFIDSVREVVSGVASAVGILKNNSIHVNSMATDSDAHLTKIAGSLETLSAEMEETSATINIISDNVSNTIFEITDLNSKALESSKHAMEISNIAYETKENIKLSTDKNIRIIEKFNDDMRTLLEKSKEIEKIDEIVSEILRVSHSTKILAQNTHIEAARVGESGRGFAVIANNMSKLNNQISDLVKRIRESNNSVKQTVSELIKNSNKMTNYMSIDIMDEYNDFVNVSEEYSNNMASTAEMFEEFSGKTKAASENITMIGERIEEIDQVVNDATYNITEVHGLAVGLRNEIENLVEIAKDNEQGSRDMVESVEKYMN